MEYIFTVKKKININPDLGLLMESLFVSPIALLAFYLLSQDGNNFFSFSDPIISFWLFLAGAVTLIPLFLWLKGIELAGLGTSGMIFLLPLLVNFY